LTRNWSGWLYRPNLIHPFSNRILVISIVKAVDWADITTGIKLMDASNKIAMLALIFLPG